MISRDVDEALHAIRATRSVWEELASFDKLASFDELRRQAMRPIGDRLAEFQTALQGPASIAGIGRYAIAPLSDMRIAGLSDGVASSLQDYRLPLGTATLHQQINDQWKPALMRWSQPTLAEIIPNHWGDVARAVSEVVRPEISTLVARATQDLFRSSMVDPSSLLVDLDRARVSVPTLPSFERSLTEIPLWPGLPEVKPEPQEEQTAPDPGGAPWGTDTATESKLEVHERRIETLEQSTARTQPSQARVFVVRAGATIVGGSIVEYIWGYTPAGEYVDLVLRGIVVYIEGASYVLPYIAP